MRRGEVAGRLLIWYWSRTGGGGSRFALRLAQCLARRFGNDAVALSLHADDPTLHEAREAGEFETLAAAVVSSRHDAFGALSGLPIAMRILAEHAHGARSVIVPMNFAVAAPLCLTLKAPLIYCAHDPEPHPGDYAALGQRATQTILLNRAARVVALSTFSAERLQRVAGKLVVAPLNSVFEPRPSPLAKGGPLRFVFAGRMIDYKGLDILADALATIRHRDTWRLVVAGDGPALTPEMQSRFLLPQVESCSRRWLSHDEHEALIASCDVVLAPYRSATQSGVVAEALARGKPSIVTPVGGLPEQVGGGIAGWVAERASGDAFGAALAAALTSAEDVRTKSQAALELAERAWRGGFWDWLGEH